MIRSVRQACSQTIKRTSAGRFGKSPNAGSSMVDAGILRVNEELEGGGEELEEEAAGRRRKMKWVGVC